MESPGRILVFAGLLAAAAPAVAAPAECALEYRFTARFDDTPRRFEVELGFDAGDRTATQVRVAREWGGVTDFERAIRNVRPNGPGTAVSAGSEAKKTWKVEHPAHGRVSVEYDLANDVANVDAETQIQGHDFYRETIGGAWFQLFGWGALLVPESLPDAEPVEACVTFSGLRKDGAFASTYGDGQVDGVAKMRMRASPLELRSAVYLGGDFRIHRRDIAGRPLIVAMRGDWRFEDAKFVDGAAAVVRTERGFWKDFAFPRYLISLVQNPIPDGSTGGTGLHDSFAMYASKDFEVPGPAFDHLIAHEHLHTWIPGRIGTMGEEEALRYWFSEGFTDYFTHRLLLASGAWTLDDYAKTLDGVILRYESSLARNAPNTVVATEFWSNPPGATPTSPATRVRPARRISRRTASSPPCAGISGPQSTATSRRSSIAARRSRSRATSSARASAASPRGGRASSWASTFRPRRSGRWHTSSREARRTRRACAKGWSSPAGPSTAEMRTGKSSFTCKRATR